MVINKKNLEDDKVKTIFQKALNLHNQGMLDEAKIIYEQIIEADPRHYDSLHLLGAIEGQKNNYTNAIDLIKKSLKINNNQPIAHYNLGLAYEELERFEIALESYENAISIKLDYAEAYNNSGSVLYKLSRFEEALVSYNRAITIKSELSVKTYNNLGLV